METAPAEKPRSRWPKRLAYVLGTLVALVLGFLYLTSPGGAVRDIWRSGIVQEVLSEPEKRAYHATTEGNLRAIYTALKLYNESEGAYPDSRHWMDAIHNRLEVNDMTAAEAQKKLVSPAFAKSPGQYGYAMNDAASMKYAGDLDPKMPLVFDSSDASRNAHGDPGSLAPNPPRAGENMAITVDGSLIKL